MWDILIPLFLVIILLLILSMVWPPDSPWAPWWRTSDEKIRKALELAKVTKKDVVYDLGCGDGRVLIIAAREFGAKGVGIEIDPLRFFIAKILVKINKVGDKVKIIRGNFFEQDLSEASVVFFYLVPKALERLKPKFLKELRPGTRVVTIKYEINLLKVREDRKNKIFLYKI